VKIAKERLVASYRLILILVLLSACSIQKEGIYRGGKLVIPGPLSVSDSYEFTLLDKWRVSHAWISGPPDIRYCSYSRRDNGRGKDRFFEVDGLMRREVTSGARDSFGQKLLAESSTWLFGVNTRTGKFEGYDAFCTHTFQDIWTGFSVFLIAPDPAKGTDEWIAGAKHVTVGNNQWLRKDDPPADYSQTPGKWAAPIETWTLPLAEGKYWLVMRLGGSTGGYGTAMGINRNPLKYEQVKAVFHQMIESVRIDPLQ
jgi:hypothetical protein